MNKKIVGLSIVGIVILAIVMVNAEKQDIPQDTSTADIPPTLLATPTYQYVAKFACGLVQPNTDDSLIISPGDYKTIINIHNPQTANISIKKKVVIASQEEPRNPIAPNVSKIGYRDLQPDYAFRMDCPDIYSLTNMPIGSFIEGFVVLYPSPSRQIDVTAIYTAGAPVATYGGSVVSMDVEVIRPKISVPVTTASYVDSPP